MLFAMWELYNRRMHERSARNTPLTQFQILADILIAPKKAFDALNQRPTWLLPVALIFLFNLLTQFVVYRIIVRDANFDQVARAKIEWDSSSASTSALSTQTQLEALRRERRYWYVLPVISIPVVLLALSLFFYVVLQFARAGTTFRKVFAVVCWSFVIYRCLGGIVVLATLLIRGSANFFPAPAEAWSPTSLAQLVPRSAVSHDAYSAISKLDVFLIWWLAVMAIGFSRVSRSLSIARSIAVVASVELLYLALNAAGLLHNRGG
jgi:hypothetical protein